jgi:hypothetical protein
VDLHCVAQPKSSSALKARPRSFHLASSLRRSSESLRDFRTVGRLPRGPGRNVAFTQDTQREVEAPSMGFGSFRRNRLR